MFKIMKIKKLAKEIGIKEVSMTESGKLILTFNDSPNIPPEKIVEFVKSKGATFTPDRKLYTEANDLDNVLKILEDL